MVYKLVICVLVTITVAVNVKAIGIPNAEDFGPILRPSNPTGARNILGYDHFETSRNTKQQIKYGNNWEQFDNEPVQDLRFNSNGGVGGNQYNTRLHSSFNGPRDNTRLNYQNPVHFN